MFRKRVIKLERLKIFDWFYQTRSHITIINYMTQEVGNFQRRLSFVKTFHNLNFKDLLETIIVNVLGINK